MSTLNPVALTSMPFPSYAQIRGLPPGQALRYSHAVIEDREHDVRAWAHLAPLEELVESAGNDQQFLGGIPFGVKDVIHVAGMPTRCGSAASDDRPAAFNAASVDLLVSAGAVPIGKTVTAEYAFRTAGSTRNPWNLAHTPGGSSSGSAAAVSAGMVPFALGTQTGGSIIRPSAYCGVAGFKPSFGALSRDGLKLTCDSLDVIGWHAASMDWLIRCAQVLLPAPQAQISATLDGACVAVIDHAPDAALEEEARTVLDEAVDALRGAGAHCFSHVADKQLALLSQAHAAIMKYEFARNLAPVVRSRSQQLSPSLLENVKEGWAIPDSLYMEMRAAQHELRTAWNDLSGGANFILAPSAAGSAPQGLEFTGSSVFNKCWSVLGWPCLHIPVRQCARGLPLGVQLIGPWNQDCSLLSYGAMLESIL